MKTIRVIAILLISFFAVNISNAQSILKKDTVKVWGNCGMCKTTIEKAARKAGAAKVNWNEESKILTFAYSAAKTSSGKIQQGIANAGYDTRDFMGSEKAYNKLHACCRYDRKTKTGEKSN
jgi:hypothetical protein